MCDSLYALMLLFPTMTLLGSLSLSDSAFWSSELERSHAQNMGYNLLQLTQRNQDLPLNDIVGLVSEQDLRDFRIVELEESVRRVMDHLTRYGNDRATIENLLGSAG